MFLPLSLLVALDLSCATELSRKGQRFPVNVEEETVAVVQARNELAEADSGSYVFYQAPGFLGSMTFSSSNTAKSSGLQVISSTP